MKDKLVKDFLDFSGAANLRSTVDVKDGLKPVHRRVLYVLNNGKDGYIGSAKVVGEVLGNFHPHSDSAVYDAAVRLSQSFRTRYPLISFEGNNGKMADPNSWAAARYTHMKLSEIGKIALKDIKKDSVDMVENYSGDLMEPLFLPGSVPITLMNGTLGIGVGMASSIPPHNLVELAKAIEYRIQNPSSKTEDLMRFIKGPDFPTGGTIINPEKILEAYKTGSGSVKIRADYDVITENGRTKIVVKEVPFLVDPTTRILGSLRELYEEGYEYIEDYEIATGKGKPFELVIILTKDAPVFEVIEKLIKETAIETSFSINLTTHTGDGKFKRMGLLALIDNYISHNIITNNRIANYEKNIAEKRKLIVEGLIKAHAEIDLVVSIIKSSSNTADANLKLCEKLDVVQEQAKAILSMRLSQLTKLDVNKLISEREELLKEIENLLAFLSSKELQLERVSEVILNLSKRFGDARRTRIQSSSEVGEVEEITAFVDNEGMIFATRTDDLNVNRRNTKGKVFENLVSTQRVDNNGHLWVVSDNGIVYPLKAASLGSSIEPLKATAENFGISGKPVQILKPTRGDYIVSLTKQGSLKKSNFDDYTMNGSFRIAKIRDGEELEKIFVVNKNDYFIMVLDNNKYVYFNESEINTTGVNTIGVKASSRELLSFDLAKSKGKVLFVDSEGTGKKIPTKDLKESGRRSAGLACNDSVFAASVVKDSFIYIWGEDNKMIRLNESSVSNATSTVAKGSILYNGKIGKILT